MKIQTIQGLGGLMIVLPGLSAGISYADSNSWPAIGDLRWILVLLGMILLIGGRIMYERELAGQDSAENRTEGKLEVSE